jgi:DGQHR domain-containing protein
MVGRKPENDTDGGIDRVAVRSTFMGKSEGYIGAVTLQWLAANVHFANEYQSLQKATGRGDRAISFDASTRERWRQRPLDWRRQAELVEYLLARETHKFPPVLVVVDAEWSDNPHAMAWDAFGKATRSTCQLQGNGDLSWLEFDSHSHLYALDGQHRLMGTLGLLELLEKGELPRYDRDRRPTGEPLKLADFLAKGDISPEYLEKLPQETIGIEFIAGVNRGETDAEAIRRIRSVFVHVNLMTVPLTKAQIVQLDENNGFAIVARHIATHHPLLTDIPNRHSRLEWHRNSIAAKSNAITTLPTLQDMATRFLRHRYSHWRSSKNDRTVPARPAQQELAAAIDAFTSIWDGLAKMHHFERLKEEDPAYMRRFYREGVGGEGYLFLRPIAQVALGQALGILTRKRDRQGLRDLLKLMQRYDLDGAFLQIDRPESLWYGVIYDPSKGQIRTSGRDLTAKLLIYLLGGITDRLEIAELRRQVVELRTFEGQAIDFKGTFGDPKSIFLPPSRANSNSRKTPSPED